MKKTCVCGKIGVFYRGKRWLYPLHNRIDTMQNSAREKGKYVPRRLELEVMFDQLQEMKCPHCKVEMQMVGKKGEKNTVSLQHDRSGRIKLLCFSCNARASTFPGDSFYDYPLDYKWCPSCEQAKPLDAFFNPNKSTPRSRAVSYCRECRKKFQSHGFKATHRRHTNDSRS